MLIMQGNDKDFKGMATIVVNKHLSTGSPLEDCIVSMAVKKELTPEEVKRLVEKSNTQLSLEHLRTEDRKEPFKLAKYERVIIRTHPTDDADNDEENQWDKENDALDEAENRHDDADNAKTASLLPVTRRRYIPKDIFGVHMQKRASKQDTLLPRDLFTLKKSLEEQKLAKFAEERAIQDKLDWLASEFSVYKAPDFAKFASDSVALCGDIARPVLAGLANYLGVPARMVKTASVVINDADPKLDAMQEICWRLGNLVKHAELIDDLDNAVSWCWREATNA